MIGLAGVKVGGLTIPVVIAGLIELIRLGTAGLVGVIEGIIGPETTGVVGLTMLVVTAGFNGRTGLSVTGLGFKKSKIPENIPFFFTSPSGGVTEGVVGLIILVVTVGLGFKRSRSLENIPFFSSPLETVSTLGLDILSTLLIGLILVVTVGFNDPTGVIGLGVIEGIIGPEPTGVTGLIILVVTTGFSTGLTTGLGLKKSKIPANIPFFFTSPSGVTEGVGVTEGIIGLEPTGVTGLTILVVTAGFIEPPSIGVSKGVVGLIILGTGLIELTFVPSTDFLLSSILSIVL